MHRNPISLPDVTSQAPVPDAAPLQWVGMEQIGLPIQFPLSDGSTTSSNAEVNAFVSLDTSAKGIHMSRLYTRLNEDLANKPVTPALLNSLLDGFLQSHHGLSESAKIDLSFPLTLSKKALLSDNYGYQSYPVTLCHEMHNGQSETTLSLTIPYSSTCPCSNSLATQLNNEAIDKQFPQDSISKEELLAWLKASKEAMATPHNQRSYAYINLQLANGHQVSIDKFIFDIESAIGTPVQTAVKREDEQEFARINGSNLMFCEDAARRVKAFLETLEHVTDYWFKIEHQESLHAHNAVVIDRKR